MMPHGTYPPDHRSHRICPQCGKPYTRFVSDEDKLTGDAKPIPDDARTCRSFADGTYVHEDPKGSVTGHDLTLTPVDVAVLLLYLAFCAAVFYVVLVLL